MSCNATSNRKQLPAARQRPTFTITPLTPCLTFLALQASTTLGPSRSCQPTPLPPLVPHPPQQPSACCTSWLLTLPLQLSCSSMAGLCRCCQRCHLVRAPATQQCTCLFRTLTHCYSTSVAKQLILQAMQSTTILSTTLACVCRGHRWL